MSKNFYGNEFKLGVLGGGQLGRMLIQEAININLSVSILDPDPNAPCKDLCSNFQVGSLTDYDTVYQFGQDVDVLTIEIENVNWEALAALEAEGKKVYPQPRIIQMVQDKGLQKQFYQQHNIPTADFYLIENKAGIAAYADQFPFMQKMRTGGYDGRGVTALKDPNNLDSAFDAPSVLEKFVDFQTEISVIVARNASGETKAFPVVELDFNPEANLVEYLFAPATVEASIQETALQIATDLIKQLDMVGLLAVEMFVTKDGQVLMNEMAPRTHNSGHHSIEANHTSQFMQHLRAILDMPLGDPSLIVPAVMVNVLGEKGFEGEAIYEGLDATMAMPGVHVHLYGKKFTRSFRKMGHVTATGETLAAAKEKAQKVKEILKVKA